MRLLPILFIFLSISVLALARRGRGRDGSNRRSNSRRKSVNDLEEETMPLIFLGPTNSSVLVGQSAFLACRASTNTRNIRWFEDGRRIGTDSTEPYSLTTAHFITGHGIIVAAKKMVNRPIKYVCEAANGFGSVRSRPAFLRVLQVGSRLNLTMNPRLRRVHLGREAVFNCKAVANPMPRIVWTKKNDSRFRVEGETLRIPRVYHVNEGVYVCNASNGRQWATLQAKLELVSSSGDTQLAGRVRKVANSPAVLKCYKHPAQNRRNVLVFWTISVKNQEYLLQKGQSMSDGRVRVNASNDLIIRNLEIGDSGNYTCQSIGGGEKVETKFILDVQRPKPSPKEIQDNVVSDSSFQDRNEFTDKCARMSVGEGLHTGSVFAPGVAASSLGQDLSQSGFWNKSRDASISVPGAIQLMPFSQMHLEGASASLVVLGRLTVRPAAELSIECPVTVMQEAQLEFNASSWFNCGSSGQMLLYPHSRMSSGHFTELWVASTFRLQDGGVLRMEKHSQFLAEGLVDLGSRVRALLGAHSSLDITGRLELGDRSRLRLQDKAEMEVAGELDGGDRQWQIELGKGARLVIESGARVRAASNGAARIELVEGSEIRIVRDCLLRAPIRIRRREQRLDTSICR